MSDDLIVQFFPEFSERELKDQLSICERKILPKGHVMLDAGQYVRLIPLVVNGSVKVIREAADGGEILLYYIKKGESCAFSVSAWLTGHQSEIKAIADEATEVILVPAKYIDDWVRKYPSWQNFIYKLYNLRFEELLQTIENIAFHKLDERLLRYLEKQLSLKNKQEISTTHQQIATNLGTSREVVSRLLKQLEKKGYIELQRNKIKILAPL